MIVYHISVLIWQKAMKQSKSYSSSFSKLFCLDIDREGNLIENIIQLLKSYQP